MFAVRPAALIAMLSAMTLACGPQDDALGTDLDADPGRSRYAIIGGTVDHGDPAVISLAYPVGGGAYESFCTGTLIGPQTVLSAAHCVDSQIPAYAVFGTETASPSFAVQIAQQVPHPMFSLQTLEADIAVWKLATPVTNVSPIFHNRLALKASDVGLSVRHIGYGVTNAATGTGSNTKREVTYQIRAMYLDAFESGGMGKQTCFGDSGGPALAVVPGTSKETVIGVVSYGDDDCAVQGIDVRVDYYAASFVEATMNQWEEPQCSTDGRCKVGCTPVDVDCACGADGMCTASCPDLSADPDCPVNCGTNDICALELCPSPDADCVAIGGACTSTLSCPSRKCIGDPQHQAKYCSESCDAPSDCPSPMECATDGLCKYPQKPTASFGDPCNSDTYCLDDAVCAGDDASDLRCSARCDASFGCPSAGQTCVTGSNGGMYCKSPTGKTDGTGDGTLLTFPQAKLEGTAASACSQTGSTSTWLLGLCALSFAPISRRGSSRALRRS